MAGSFGSPEIVRHPPLVLSFAGAHLDRNRAPMGPDFLSNAGAQTWRKEDIGACNRTEDAVRGVIVSQNYLVLVLMGYRTSIMRYVCIVGVPPAPALDKSRSPK